MNILYSSDFPTEIGVVSSILESNINDPFQISAINNSTTIETSGHIINLVTFKLKNEWIPSAMRFEDSHGWIWKIKKKKNINEKFLIKCTVLMPSKNLTSAPDSGECLDAIEIESENKVLHIGTEDGECLWARAKASDFMPGRLIKYFGKDPLSYSFTEYLDFGFKTEIPDLRANEQIYFHFLSAINTIKPSIQYPDERDVSTWFAVDQTKNFLEKELNLI